MLIDVVDDDETERDSDRKLSRESVSRSREAIGNLGP